MAKTQDDEKALTPFEPLSFVTGTDDEPVVLANVLAEMGLSGPRMKAETIVDATFDIMRARAFPSAYEGQDHAYFVVGRMIETGQMFTVVLGGAAVVDTIDSYVRARRSNPLRVTLRYNEGGRYSGYYVLE